MPFQGFPRISYCGDCGNEYLRNGPKNIRCLACQSATNIITHRHHSKRYRVLHKDKCRIYRVKYYAENKELILARGAKYRRENPEKRKETVRNSDKRHRTARAAKLKQWRMNNRERARKVNNDGQRRRRLENPGKFIAHDRLRFLVRRDALNISNRKAYALTKQLILFGVIPDKKYSVTECASFYRMFADLANEQEKE